MFLFLAIYGVPRRQKETDASSLSSDLVCKENTAGWLAGLEIYIKAEQCCDEKIILMLHYILCYCMYMFTIEFLSRLLYILILFISASFVVSRTLTGL